jgi:SAM-dependent methyltransferase
MTTSPYRNPAMVEVYRRITAPGQFAEPARDLVALLRPSPGARILDLGTGTGIVAQAARRLVGTGGTVVGVDASIEMLRVARRAPSGAVVAGTLPSLPFRDCSFDVVAASFVISHVGDYEGALRDAVRVCRARGRFGLTAWGTLPNPAARLWNEIAGRFVPGAELDSALAAHVPWEGLLSEPTTLRRLLVRAGLARPAIETRIYRCRMPTHDFLTSREASIQGGVLNDRLTADARRDFKNQAAAAFHAQFGRMVEYDRDVHLAVGTKP